MPVSVRRSSPVQNIVALLLLILLAVGWWQRQYIYDEIRLYGYTPPTAVTQLAADDTMTSSARRMYYVNHPALEPRASFSDYCPSGTEQSVVLGCYKAPQRGIYLLQVDNNELQGIEQVTAAHETLHAAYDRLSSGERQRVNALLQSYFDNKLPAGEIKDTINSYRKTEPHDVVNEMHSIIGTEVANLPPQLEQYYSQYFTNRAKIVGYYTAYNQAFTSRKAQIQADDKQLQQQKAAIESLEATVSQQQANLQSQRATLDQERASNNISAYNSGVNSYNSAVDAYNANVRRLRSMIADYNALVEKRNAIAFQEQNLVNAISAPKVSEQ